MWSRNGSRDVVPLDAAEGNLLVDGAVELKNCRSELWVEQPKLSGFLFSRGISSSRPAMHRAREIVQHGADLHGQTMPHVAFDFA